MEAVNLLKILETGVSLRMQPGSPRHWALLALAEVGKSSAASPQHHHRNKSLLWIPADHSPVNPRAWKRARGTPVQDHLQALVDKALYESQAEMNCFNEITESNHSGFPLPVCERGEAMPLMFLFTWFLCYPAAKNPKSTPLSIFRLTLHELPAWSTPWTVVFPVRFVSKYHFFNSRT